MARPDGRTFQNPATQRIGMKPETEKNRKMCLDDTARIAATKVRNISRKVIHVPIGTTRRMKMVASQCRRPMTGGRFASSASSLGKVGPEHSKETRSVAPRRCREARIRESFQDECSFGLG